MSKTAAESALPKALNTPQQYSGAMKACLWILSTEEQTAINALKCLSPAEILQVRACAQSLSKVPPEHLQAIHQEFKEKVGAKSLAVQGSVDYLNRLTSKALGDSNAAILFAPQDVLPQDPILQSADIDTICAILDGEHPQIISALLATLGPKKAASVLLRFSDETRNAVLMRMGQLKSLPQEALVKAQQLLAQKVPQASHKYSMDGIREVAMMLNQLTTEQSEQFLEQLPDKNMTQKIREGMFTFEDLSRLDKRNLQNLLKEIATDQLLIALKASSESLRDKIFSGLSQRAAAMLREEFELLGPTKISDVEAAQAAIVATALNLRTAGRITVSDTSGNTV